MKITCRHCGIVSRPHECPMKKRKYDYTREDKKIYVSKRYRKVREQVLNDYNNICLFSLAIEGKIRPAYEVHHIVEIIEDSSKAYDYDNLIPLTEFRHREVHNLYKKDKANTQELLRTLCKNYIEKGIKGVKDTPLPSELCRK